jgi:hypothetical protein
MGVAPQVPMSNDQSPSEPLPPEAPQSMPPMTALPSAPPNHPPTRRAGSHVQAVAVIGMAVLVMVAVAYPRRSLAPTCGPDQVPRFQSADVAPVPQASGSPAPVAAASLPRPVAAASGAASVVAPAHVAAAKPATNAYVPAEPPATKNAAAPSRPTWSELTRHLNSGGGSPESADASASIDADAAGSGIREAIAASESAALGVPIVTLTGCLEMSTDQQDFRLTDTEGADAPKSRSWHSGFLQKRSVPVALEAPGSFALKGDVGRRVAATGVLSGRALTVRSLRVVGASCD